MTAIAEPLSGTDNFWLRAGEPGRALGHPPAPDASNPGRADDPDDPLLGTPVELGRSRHQHHQLCRGGEGRRGERRRDRPPAAAAR